LGNFEKALERLGEGKEKIVGWWGLERGG